MEANSYDIFQTSTGVGYGQTLPFNEVSGANSHVTNELEEKRETLQLQNTRTCKVNDNSGTSAVFSTINNSNGDKVHDFVSVIPNFNSKGTPHNDALLQSTVVQNNLHAETVTCSVQGISNTVQPVSATVSFYQKTGENIGSNVSVNGCEPNLCNTTEMPLESFSSVPEETVYSHTGDDLYMKHENSSIQDDVHESTGIDSSDFIQTVIDPSSLSENSLSLSSNNLINQRFFNSTSTDFAYPGHYFIANESQSTAIDSEQSQDSISASPHGRPPVHLNLSHLLQAAAASPFSSDLIDSPLSSDATYNFDNSRSLQGTPEPDLMNPRPKAGPRRKKTWLIEDEEDPDKTPLSSELRHGLRILKEIMSDINKSLNWPFMDPVNEAEVPDYYERIESPMWLRKMRNKFDNREYSTITEFVADFRLMLENCYRFNGPDHLISRRGQRLETVLEQKLALLSRELREKTTIAATSGKLLSEKELFSGTRRRKAIVPHDSTALLQQLRQEQQDRVKEHRKMQVQERKTAQEQFVKELDDWEDALYPNPELKREMRSMWEIPQIGHFLYLCLCPYDLGEVTQWELERSFLIPRESTTMQRVMTSLLSTPFQRTQLEKKPPMPYKVWNERLNKKLFIWYKMLKSNGGDITKTATKLGIEEKFFLVVGRSNPLERKKYHELSVYQRVWIMKSLCDYCLEHQENLREAIEAVQPVEDQNCYICGTDGDGYTYIHFPQFCGADVRIYKQAPYKYPKLEMNTTPEAPKHVHRGRSKYKGPSPKKKRKEVRENTPDPGPRQRHSRLRQNPRQASTLTESTMTPTTSDFESGEDNSNDDDEQSTEEEEEEVLPRKSSQYRARSTRRSKVQSQQSTPCASRSTTPTARSLRSPSPAISSTTNDSIVDAKGRKNILDIKNIKCEEDTRDIDNIMDTEDSCDMVIDMDKNRGTEKIIDPIKREDDDDSLDNKEVEDPFKTYCSETKNSKENGEENKEADTHTPQTDVKNECLENEAKDSDDVKVKEEAVDENAAEDMKEPSEIKSESPLNDTGAADDITVNEVKEVKEEVLEDDGTTDVKEEVVNGEEEVKEEYEEEVPEILGPDLDEFELMVDSVEALRQLARQFEEPEVVTYGSGKKQRTVKPIPRKKCVKELHERLLYLIKELDPWEQKLIAAHKKMRIKLRKEHEAYIEPEEVEDIWESEESSSEKSDDEGNDKNVDEDSKDPDVKEESLNQDDDSGPKLADLLIPGVSTRSGRNRKRHALNMQSKDEPAVKKKATTEANAPTMATTPIKQGSGGPVLSLKSPLVIKSPDGKVEVVPNLDPKHPALKNATLFAQLPSGTTVAVSLATVMGGSNQQQQQVMRALLSAGKLSIATAAQTQVMMANKAPNATATKVQQSPTVSPSPGSVVTTQLPLSPAALKPITTQQNMASILQMPAASSQTTSAPTFCVAPKGQSAVPSSIAHLILKNVPAADSGLPQKQNDASNSCGISTTMTTNISECITKVSTATTTNSPNLLQQSISKPIATNSSSQPGSDSTATPQSEYFHYNSLDKLPPNVIHQLLKTQPQRLKDIQTTDASVVKKTDVLSGIKAFSTASSSRMMEARSLAASSPSKPPKYATNVTVKALLESRAAASNKDNTKTDSPTSALRMIVPVTTSPKIQVVSKPNLALAPRVPLTSSNKQQPVQYVLTNSRQIAPRPPSASVAQGIVIAGAQSPRVALAQASPAGLQVLPNATTAAPAAIRFVVSSSVNSVQVPAAASISEATFSTVPRQIQFVQTPFSANQVGSQQVLLTGQQVQQGHQVQVVHGQSQVQLLQQLNAGQQVQGQNMQLVQQVQNSQPIVSAKISETPPSKPKIAKVTSNPVSETEIKYGNTNDNKETMNSEGISNVDTVNENSDSMQAAMALQELSQLPGVTASIDDLQAGEALTQLAQGSSSTSLVHSSDNSPGALQTSSFSSPPSTPSHPSSDDLPRIAVSVIGTNTVDQVPQSAATVLKVKAKTTGGKPVAVNTAQLKALIAKKQEAIDKAVKTVITEAPTTLPTAQIKVSSPFTPLARQPHRPVTITAGANKGPISAVPKLDVGKTIPGTTVTESATSTITQQQEVTTVKNATSVLSPTTSPVPKPSPGQKNLVLKVTPTTIQTPQGLMQGIVIPSSVNLPQHVLQQLIAQKGQNMVILQQSKDNALSIVHTPPGLNLKLGTQQQQPPPKPAMSQMNSSTEQLQVSSSAFVSTISLTTTKTLTNRLSITTTPSVCSSVVASTVQSVTNRLVAAAPTIIGSNKVPLVPDTSKVTVGNTILPQPAVLTSVAALPKKQSLPAQNLLHSPKQLSIVNPQEAKLTESTVSDVKKQLANAMVTQSTVKQIAGMSATSSAKKPGKVFIAPSPVKDSQSLEARTSQTQTISKVDASLQAQQQQKRLVLLNVNGQLLTQQGVPVTLSGGVLRPITPNPTVTSPPPPGSVSLQQKQIKSPVAYVVGSSASTSSSVQSSIHQAVPKQLIQQQPQAQKVILTPQKSVKPAPSNVTGQKVKLAAAVQQMKVSSSSNIASQQASSISSPVRLPVSAPIQTVRIPAPSRLPVSVARLPTVCSVAYQPVQVHTGAGLVLQTGAQQQAPATGGLVIQPQGLLQLPGGLVAVQGLPTQQPLIIQQQGQTVLQTAAQGQAVLQTAAQGQTVLQAAAPGQAVIQSAGQGPTVLQTTGQGQAVLQTLAQGQAVLQTAAQGQVVLQAGQAQPAIIQALPVTK